MTGCDHPWATQDEIGRPYCQACGEPWEQVRKERAMNHPHARPCQSGPCTEKGLSTPGFCKCKADAAEIDRLQEAKRRALKLADERAKEANESAARIVLLENALKAIKRATLNGDVCDDVAWFDQIETLHDFCGRILGDSP